MQKPRVFIFYGPNGAGKGTQGEKIAEPLRAAGALVDVIDSWGDLIQPRVYPAGTDQDWTFRFTLHTQPGIFTRTRSGEREINKAGEFNSPDWVSWLACRVIRERLVDGIVPIMTGTSRTPLEGREVAAEIAMQHEAGIAGGAVVIGLLIDIETAKQRIRDRMPTLPPAQQEKEQYKIDKMDRRFEWYFNDTLPGIAELKRSLTASTTPLTAIDITDDGTMTPQEIHEKIWKELQAHKLV